MFRRTECFGDVLGMLCSRLASLSPRLSDYLISWLSKYPFPLRFALLIILPMNRYNDSLHGRESFSYVVAIFRQFITCRLNSRLVSKSYCQLLLRPSGSRRAHRWIYHSCHQNTRDTEYGESEWPNHFLHFILQRNSLCVHRHGKGLQDVEKWLFVSSYVVFVYF